MFVPRKPPSTVSTSAATMFGPVTPVSTAIMAIAADPTRAANSPKIETAPSTPALTFFRVVIMRGWPLYVLPISLASVSPVAVAMDAR